MKQITVVVRAPVDCVADDISAFKQLVLSGGEVTPETLPGLVSRALTLGFGRAGERLVAVGAIKRPNPAHRDKVFAQAGVERDPSKFAFELGWVYVLPSARRRGLARSLVATLISSLNGRQAYATSAVNNAPMHTLLNRFGFKPTGAPYPSQLNDPAIRLFLCE